MIHTRLMHEFGKCTRGPMWQRGLSWCMKERSKHLTRTHSNVYPGESTPRARSDGFRSWQLGIFFGPILCIIQAVQHYFLYLIEFLRPEDEIEEVEAHWDPVQFAKVSSYHMIPLTNRSVKERRPC